MTRVTHKVPIPGRSYSTALTREAPVTLPATPWGGAGDVLAIPTPKTPSGPVGGLPAPLARGSKPPFGWTEVRYAVALARLREEETRPEAEADISDAHPLALRVIETLRERGPMPAAEIADHLKVHIASMAGALRSLKRHGMAANEKTYKSGRCQSEWRLLK